MEQGCPWRLLGTSSLPGNSQSRLYHTQDPDVQAVRDDRDGRSSGPLAYWCCAASVTTPGMLSMMKRHVVGHLRPLKLKP